MSSIQGPSFQSETLATQNAQPKRKQISLERHKEIEDVMLEVIKKMKFVINYYKDETVTTIESAVSVAQCARKRAEETGSKQIIEIIKKIETEAERIISESKKQSRAYLLQKNYSPRL